MAKRDAKKAADSQAFGLDRLMEWIQTDKAAAEKPAAQYRGYMKQFHRLIPFSAATLKVRRTGGARLKTVLEIDGGAEILDFVDLGAGCGMSGYSLEEIRPIVVNRHSNAQLTESPRLERLVSFPLRWMGEVWGVLNIGLAQAEDLTEARLSQLHAATVPLAAMLAQNDLKRLHSRLIEDHERIMNDLARARYGLEALEQVAQAAETAACVVHQVNNPLSVVIGNIQCLIAERAVPNQKALSRLKRAERAALEIADVNRRLLDIHAMHEKETATSGQAPASSR